MRFGVIRPSRQELRYFEAKDMDQALVHVGLKRLEIDHGTVMPGIAIVVHELSLFKRPQSYFAIRHRLYGGNALLYGFEPKGATIDLAPLTETVGWLPDQETAEIAISLGQVERPQMAVGNDVLWSWPKPRPTDEEHAAFMLKYLPKDGGTIKIDDVTIHVSPPEKDTP
jgi:hypothetical protein